MLGDEKEKAFLKVFSAAVVGSVPGLQESDLPTEYAKILVGKLSEFAAETFAKNLIATTHDSTGKERSKTKEASARSSAKAQVLKVAKHSLQWGAHVVKGEHHLFTGDWLIRKLRHEERDILMLESIMRENEIVRMRERRHTEVKKGR